MRCAGPPHAVDAIAAEMRTRPFAGRREIDVHRELVERMLEAGHERANFAIVAAAANAASPHHEPSDPGDRATATWCCATSAGRWTATAPTSPACSWWASPPPRCADTYAVLVEAQEAGVQAATVGTPCAEVDAAARRVIADAGFGERFVHRTGHGIGTEAHEDPYIVAGNADAARARPRVQHRARHLPARPLRPAARGHRRRDRRRVPTGSTRHPRDLAVVG